MEQLDIVKNRNSNIEMLRFLMMFGICLWHILMHGYGLKSMATNEAHPSYLQIVSMCILAPATNCFMFISGYFGLKLKREKIISLFFQAAFYYVLCWIIRDVLHYGPKIGWGYIAKNLFPLTNHSWWFLNWYFVLMLLSPLIKFERRKKKDTMIVLLMIFVNCFGLWLNHRCKGNDLMGLLTIYMLGRLLSVYYKKIERFSSYIWFFVFFFSTSVLIAFSFLAASRNYDQTIWNLMMYNNPLICLQSISLFYFTKGLHDKSLRFTVFGERIVLLFISLRSLQKVYSMHYGMIYMKVVGCLLCFLLCWQCVSSCLLLI